MTTDPRGAIIKSQKGNKRKEVKKMKKTTQGWYTFADGYRVWFYGLSAQEKKVEVFHHGKVVKFEPTNF